MDSSIFIRENMVQELRHKLEGKSRSSKTYVSQLRYDVVNEAAGEELQSTFDHRLHLTGQIGPTIQIRFLELQLCREKMFAPVLECTDHRSANSAVFLLSHDEEWVGPFLNASGKCTNVDKSGKRSRDLGSFLSLCTGGKSNGARLVQDPDEEAVAERAALSQNLPHSPGGLHPKET